MPNPVVARLTRPAITRWLALPEQSWRRVAPPSEDSQQVAGKDPDRILLIGSGIAMGYGVDSHEDALAGHLARKISARTGRGTRIDVFTDRDMSAEKMTAALDRQCLGALDAIIATPLGIESLLIISRARWRRHLRHLLDHITHVAPRSVQLYLVGLPAVHDLTDLPPWLSALSRRAHRRLNHDLERFCAAHPQARFVELTAVERADRDSSRRLYDEVAEFIAPTVAEGLNGQCVDR